MRVIRMLLRGPPASRPPLCFLRWPEKDFMRNNHFFVCRCSLVTVWLISPHKTLCASMDKEMGVSLTLLTTARPCSVEEREGQTEAKIRLYVGFSISLDMTNLGQVAPTVAAQPRSSIESATADLDRVNALKERSGTAQLNIACRGRDGRPECLSSFFQGKLRSLARLETFALQAVRIVNTRSSLAL